MFQRRSDVKLTLRILIRRRPFFSSLGHNPHIVRFLGLDGDKILLAEASHGNLQTYLDTHPETPLPQRLIWCRQAAKAVAYIHSRGVTHSDLRPANMLLHETAPGTLELQLADFGGSVCTELGLDGFSLPDGPFYSPVFNNEATPMLDLFGLESIFYTIITGRWPYKADPGRFENVDERIKWEETVVYPNFSVGRFPDVSALPAGDVMLRCWKREFATAADVVAALEASLQKVDHTLATI